MMAYLAKPGVVHQISLVSIDEATIDLGLSRPIPKSVLHFSTSH